MGYLDPILFVINISIPGIVLITGVSLSLSALLYGKPAALNFEVSPATAFSFYFWLAWWLSVLLGYLLIFLLSAACHPLVLGVLDTGDLCLIAAAITYCLGDSHFRWSRLGLLALALVAVVLFYLLFGVLSALDHITPWLALLMCAPSILIANVAVTSMGWAFHARWGYTALLLLLGSIAYAMLQYPAFFYVFVARRYVVDPSVGSQISAFENLKYIFYALAFGKAILAVPFFLFFGTKGHRPDMTEPARWPSTTVTLDPRLVKGIWWALIGILTIVLMALVRETWSRILDGNG